MALAGALIPLAVYTVNSQGKLPPWPPVRWQALLWAGLPLIPVAGLGLRRLGIAMGAFGLIAAGGFWQALGPYRQNQWAATNELWLWLPALVFASTALYGVLAWGMQRQPQGPLRPLLLTVVLAAAAKIIADSGSGTSAMMLGGLCFWSGGLCVLSLWRRDLPVMRGTAAHFAWVPFALLFQVKFYASLELGPAVLLVLALAATSTSSRSVPASLLRSLIVVGLTAAAVALAWPEPDPMGY